MASLCQGHLESSLGAPVARHGTEVFGLPSTLIEHGVCLNDTSSGGRTLIAYATPWVLPVPHVCFLECCRMQLNVSSIEIEQLAEGVQLGELENRVQKWTEAVASPFLAARAGPLGFSRAVRAQGDPFSPLKSWSLFALAYLCQTSGDIADELQRCETFMAGTASQVHYEDLGKLLAVARMGRPSVVEFLEQCLIRRLAARRLGKYFSVIWNSRS